MRNVKLLALAASTRPQSHNKRLLNVAVGHARDAGAQVTVIDYAACDAPLYQGVDSPLPPSISMLSAALKEHDGILLASPEYNWSMPGALKNLIDWLSVDPTAPLKGRSALLICASPSIRGGILGLHQLSLPLAHLGVYVYPHLVAIGDAATHLTENGIQNTKDAEFLKSCVFDFIGITHPARR